MNIYFDNENELYKHFACKISQKVAYKKEDWADLDKVLKYYKQATEEVIGKSFDSEIFYWESIVYMEVSKYLLDNGYDVLQCYDCWYCNESIDSNKVNEIIKNKINNIRNNNKDNNIYNSSKLQNKEVEDMKMIGFPFCFSIDELDNDDFIWFGKFMKRKFDVEISKFDVLYFPTDRVWEDENTYPAFWLNGDETIGIRFCKRDFSKLSKYIKG